MVMTEKEWCMLAEARGLDPETGKPLEPEYDVHGSPLGNSAWTDRDIAELHRAIRGLHNDFTMITRLIVLGIGAMAILHFVNLNRHSI